MATVSYVFSPNYNIFLLICIERGVFKGKKKKKEVWLRSAHLNKYL